ncbi:MAG: glucose-1-phosphate adenylyltransferase subunit GlgD [Oscillospiraceae bacterium]|jgi:glucose-1-phosphate adenylyltransferase|nr:glucose-1-phosphate adenylyltransferase subunit GlgD [Oscillospiraceae bacterium]
MRANNVLGLIYSNGYDACLNELTALRTMGSVPFGGRYRLIDFVLSGMVNCGIPRIGIITKSNYNSLMDHVGNGRAWDLARKRDGLFLLPPFNFHNSGTDNNRIRSLIGTRSWLAASGQEYVVISDCNVLGNIDYEKILAAHEEKGADITVCYARGKMPALPELMAFDVSPEGCVEKITISPKTDEKQNYSLNIFVLRKSLLERLLHEAESHNYTSFERDILQQNSNHLEIYAYRPGEFCRTIDCLQTYYDVSMEILNPAYQRELFNPHRPVYTKVRDDVPVIYGLESAAKNALIADGCVIEGTVENCILFRGVRIGRGAVVKNAIIMQEAFIGDECCVNSVIIDKNVTIKPHKQLCGDMQYPFYIGKGLVI